MLHYTLSTPQSHTPYHKTRGMTPVLHTIPCEIRVQNPPGYRYEPAAAERASGTHVVVDKGPVFELVTFV